MSGHISLVIGWFGHAVFSAALLIDRWEALGALGRIFPIIYTVAAMAALVVVAASASRGQP